MAGLRPPRPVDPGSVGAPPRCLRLRGVSDVWGDDFGDPLAPHRWRAAAERWRAAARASGMGETKVWSALPGGAYRFDADYYVEETLRHYGYTVDDLPVMAAEARQHYPELFDAGWSLQVERSGWGAAAGSLANRTP